MNDVMHKLSINKLNIYKVHDSQHKAQGLHKIYWTQKEIVKTFHCI